MGSGSGPATCTSERRPRPAGGAAGHGVGCDPDDGAVGRIRRRGPGGRFRARGCQTVFWRVAAPAEVRSVPKDRLTAAEHPHAAYDDAQEDVSAEITEDFDLRRAVIYSEILKPKFDE